MGNFFGYIAGEAAGFGGGGFMAGGTDSPAGGDKQGKVN